MYHARGARPPHRPGTRPNLSPRWANAILVSIVDISPCFSDARGTIALLRRSSLLPIYWPAAHAARVLRKTRLSFHDRAGEVEGQLCLLPTFIRVGSWRYRADLDVHVQAGRTPWECHSLLWLSLERGIGPWASDRRVSTTFMLLYRVPMFAILSKPRPLLKRRLPKVAAVSSCKWPHQYARRASYGNYLAYVSVNILESYGERVARVPHVSRHICGFLLGDEKEKATEDQSSTA
ncbi:hypothetical protein C8Q80DRAFT_1141961 [Daedaleopsis nitida]|nr:hypothetical protein C8Q80DRAFT_1141961 [Daedaleopsis nitida]